MDEDRILAAIAESSRENRLQNESIRIELTSFRTEVMSRFERIENRLTSMADDITVNMLAVSAENQEKRG